MKKITAICVLMTFSMFSCSDAKSQNKSEQLRTNNNFAKSDSETMDNFNSGEDIILTMPIMAEHQFFFGERDLVKEFNDADNGYKIVLKDYAKDFDTSSGEGISHDSALDYDREQVLDIMKGGIIDIIPNSFFDPGKFNILAEKGAYADLSSFIDNDDEIHRDELFDTVLEACEINNELKYMPLSFSINTIFGNKKYVGDKENWTFDEMKDLWEKMPDGSTINGHTTKDYVYYALLRGNIDSFIDYDKAECHFNSDEFVDMLDFLNSFDCSNGYKEDIDYSNAEFLRSSAIYGFRQYHQFFYNISADEMTFVGYPSDNNCGSFFDIGNSQIAISATSSPEKQQGAWEFIRMLVSYDCQYGNGFSGAMFNNSEFALPINRKAFDDMGKELYNHEKTSGDNAEEDYLTKAEYDRLVELIEKTKKVNIKMEEDIFEIINDEIFALFNNEKTSKEVANHIQDRVQLLINERV
ncbi:ABC transporter substrate-binding protein [Ruminococcus flavefaciens]|uniref:ABC transporter substrate-binding protein n=1 Tax=Ruminococcus flavefaciens TaxID=1265 RepID=UPI0026F0BE65|nr:extracellular solute-binding protein [Ruminococcus flavefaciens]